MTDRNASSAPIAGRHYPGTVVMDTMYGLIVAVILLFPWSLVGIMVAGSVWERVRLSGRVRDRR